MSRGSCLACADGNIHKLPIGFTHNYKSPLRFTSNLNLEADEATRHVRELISVEDEGNGFVPGGVGARAAAGKLASYREVLLRQPPRVAFQPFTFETFGELNGAEEELLKRHQGLVNQAVVAHEDLVWFTTQRRVIFTIACAVERQLASLLPYGGCTSDSKVVGFQVLCVYLMRRDAGL
eukprot:jgi/Botrbrau1/7706/Bobra.0159s0141.1